MLYEDLNRALGGMNLESDLHLLYLITPQDKGIYPDFRVSSFVSLLAFLFVYLSVCSFACNVASLFSVSFSNISSTTFLLLDCVAHFSIIYYSDAYALFSIC